RRTSETPATGDEIAATIRVEAVDVICEPLHGARQQQARQADCQKEGSGEGCQRHPDRVLVRLTFALSGRSEQRELRTAEAHCWALTAVAEHSRRSSSVVRPRHRQGKAKNIP